MIYEYTIQVNHRIGDIVYLRTDKEQLPRLVTRLNVSDTDVRYELAQGLTSTWHFAIEISTERDTLLPIT